MVSVSPDVDREEAKSPISAIRPSAVRVEMPLNRVRISTTQF
jgi:hypothetical protein